MSDKIEKTEDKEKEVKLPEGVFLDPEVFAKKYNTTFAQMHPESFLEEVSEEDRENWADFEILSGRRRNNNFNKFNNWGSKNAGKRYDKSDKALNIELARWKDGLIDTSALSRVFDKVLEQSLAGDLKSQQFLIERLIGKVSDKLEVKTEGNVVVDLNIPSKFHKAIDDAENNL